MACPRARALPGDSRSFAAKRITPTASCHLRWLAQPRLHGLFVGEVVLIFLLFKGKLMNHTNHRTRLGAVQVIS